MTRRRHEPSPRGIVRDRETEIEYGSYLGPRIRPYEAEALRSGHTHLSVEEWDWLSGDGRRNHHKEREL